MYRHLQYNDEKSSKFWEVEVAGSSVTVRYGRIGTKGQMRKKDHGSPEAALDEANKLIAAKERKGYSPVFDAGARAPRSGTEQPSTSSLNDALSKLFPDWTPTTQPCDEFDVWTDFLRQGGGAAWPSRTWLAGHERLSGLSFREFTDCCAPSHRPENDPPPYLADKEATLVSICSNAVLISGCDDDEYALALCKTPHGAGQAAYEYHWPDSEFRLITPSLASLVSGLDFDDLWWRQDFPSPEVHLERHLDPAYLSTRVEWLSRLIYDARPSRGTMADDTENCPAVTEYDVVAPVLANHLHLAVYWLFHHLLAGNWDDLEDWERRCAASKHPWIQELREDLATWLKNPESIRVGALTFADVEAFQQEAPDRCFRS